MKKKLIEQVALPKWRKKGWWTIVQEVDDIIILNIFSDGIFRARHCIDIARHDYATYTAHGEWNHTKIEQSYDINTEWQYGSYNKNDAKRRFKVSPEDGALLLDRFSGYDDYMTSADDVFGTISRSEYDWAYTRRSKAEERRQQRVEDTMSKIPQLPDIKDWLYETVIGEDYALRKEKKWYCTVCRNSAEREQYKRDNGETARNNDIVTCPHCGSRIKFKIRAKYIFTHRDYVIMQPIDDTMSVIRFCVTRIKIDYKGKDISQYEKIRVLAGRGTSKVDGRNVYYRQWGNIFDNKSNPSQMRIADHQYLYPVDISEALEGTRVDMWSKLFEETSRSGLELAYDKLMTSFDSKFHSLMELLYRGRFYKLLHEESGKMSATGAYYGVLNIKGTSIEKTFSVCDRQLINRLRDKDGGRLMLAWLQWSERNKKKLTDKTLTWLLANELWPERMQWAKLRLSPEQAMNYLERQRRESYKGLKVRDVINQYEDYMDMCKKLKKDTTDEMVYRPRELKRRHDEAVAEIALREAEIKAEEYSERYPEAEKVLGEIKAKLEYSDDSYMIIVPQKISEIVAEGRVLEHCVGKVDRYFDRIAQRETYICFLRKTEEPTVPYYTIEVEPGGTIRQHRGFDDKEPEINKIKPFLREWQKEIRKRMSNEDHELASVSEVKREENIKELQQKNNTRVLEGLMQDFMEAAG